MFKLNDFARIYVAVIPCAWSFSHATRKKKHTMDICIYDGILKYARSEDDGEIKKNNHNQVETIHNDSPYECERAHHCAAAVTF